MRIDVAGQLQQLQSLIDSFNLRKPAARRFTHRLDDARRALNKRKHSTKHFCEELGEFIRDVRRQTGRSVPRSNHSFTRSLSVTDFCPALPLAMALFAPVKLKALEIGHPRILTALIAASNLVLTD